jgi:MSHA biogenesis protein MshO
MTVMSKFQHGFTLIEAIIVIVVGGIMVAAVAMFLRWPFQGYLDTARRGQMSDLIDTALRRMGRDLRIALPNSARVSPAAGCTSTGNCCIEMLPTIAGGRYRAAVDSAGHGDILDFTMVNGDPTFNMFGQFPAAYTPAAGNMIVVYNLGPTSPGADAYNGDTTRPFVSQVFPSPSEANETQITINTLNKPFPLASPANRFQVISGTAVSYVCTPTGTDAQGNGTGTLSRVAGYAITPAPSCPPAGGTSTLLAKNVTICNIEYSPAGPSNTTAREGLVQMQLGVTLSNETVSLDHEVHISNAP